MKSEISATPFVEGKRVRRIFESGQIELLAPRAVELRRDGEAPAALRVEQRRKSAGRAEARGST
jgi:hypothetical protein